MKKSFQIFFLFAHLTLFLWMLHVFFSFNVQQGHFPLVQLFLIGIIFYFLINRTAHFQNKDVH